MGNLGGDGGGDVGILDVLFRGGRMASEGLGDG